MKNVQRGNKIKKIPKIIHYFWFGTGEMPPIFNECLKSWNKNCPDFEIKKWDESNFDINISPYVKDAYEQKKYAFVSDYARFYILKKYGGVYLDIDVELIKPIDELLDCKSFCGFEYNSNLVNPGLILGSVPEGDFVSKVLDYYNTLKEFKFGTHTVCTISTKILNEKYDLNLKMLDTIQRLNEVNVYPAEYFCAYDQIAKRIVKSNKTISIHHYNASWLSKKDKIINWIKKIIYLTIGQKNYEKIKTIIKKKG